MLWRRRWNLIFTVCVAVGAAVLYLRSATPIYRSSARLLVDANPAQVYPDGDRGAVSSEHLVQTQVDALQSTPVLSRALEMLPQDELRTFARVGGRPIDWLRDGGALQVEAVKRADTVVVSMESPDPQEATQILDAVVKAHIAEQLAQRRQTGQAMLQALEQEKSQLDARSQACRERINEHRRRHGILSFADDRSNATLERTAALTESVTNAQLATVELKARKQAVEAALADPASRSAFVSTELMKGRDAGDREYDELRTLLTTSEIALAVSKMMQAPDNRGILAQEARLNTLRDQLTEKEMRLAEAHRVELNTKIAAAEAQHAELKAALAAQQKEALELSAALAEHGKLVAELEALQRQSAAVADRILRVNVNTFDNAPLPVRIAEPARAEPNPVKPQKPIILLGALLVGGLAGVGLVLLREQHDQRLRHPDEAVGLIGQPLLAMVPRIARKLPPSQRGQLLRLDAHSPAAEAYRAVRTALRLGSTSSCKSVLITSATAGDGKSTTASNLAIAFAQAGERTLLVDCDLRRPVQHLTFDLDGSRGIATVLAGESKLGDAIQSTPTANLFVLPCGAVPTHPSEQLAGKRFALVMQRLVETFDRVILDSPPVLTVTDAQILAATADATLLVFRFNHSSRQLVRYCRDALERVGARMLGVIANDLPTAMANQYYGGRWPYGAPPHSAAKHSAAKHSAANLPARAGPAAVAVPPQAATASVNGAGQPSLVDLSSQGDQTPVQHLQTPRAGAVGV